VAAVRLDDALREREAQPEAAGRARPAPVRAEEGPEYVRQIPLGDADPAVDDADLLAERARLAFLEWTPIRIQPDDARRIHRAFHFGPLLDVFLLDMRGAAMEGVANGDGPALGRELELAGLLSFLKAAGVTNVVWLTADVHYTAAHHYHPSRARFTDFTPFWEMVSGPLHAGTFGPNALDDTFGPEVRFQKAPPPGQVNLPPSAGLQFFGEVRISAKDRAMTVNLRDVTGAVLFSQVIAPEGG
jgi:phosphodiesterase/alkaline phosphatase D-like protein